MSRPVLVIAFILAITVLNARGESAPDQGKTDFMAHCASCHGEDGKGGGPDAAGLKTRPADLSSITARNGGSFPEDRIFETIAGLDMPADHGTRDMPIWGDVFVSESIGKSVELSDAMKASDEATQRIMRLVRFIATIQVAP